MSHLFEYLRLTKGDGRCIKVLVGFAKTDLFVLDDCGPAKLSRKQQRNLQEIVEFRHDVRSALVANQFPIEHWHKQIGDPPFADSAMDRLAHNADKIQLKGGLRRKKNSDLTV